MFVLAHLSDPHLSPLPQPRWRELLSKRIVGYVNWRLRRHLHHSSEALAALIADMKAQRPDHIAVLGDLINIGLPAEFAPAHDFLARLGPPQDVTLVPGNHDSYVRSEARTFLSVWRDYLAGDPPASDPEAENAFPFLRRRDGMALIGVSTALPTLPFLATGRAGLAQLERLESILTATGHEGLFRVVLIHHPPAGWREPHKVLTDAAAFRAVIAACGAELILHGHDHRASHLTIPGPRGVVPVIGVPSASSPVGDRKPAAYNLYRLTGTPGAWNCEMESRGFRSDGTIATLARTAL